MKLYLPLCLLLLSFNAYGALTKWVDADGKVHYSDEPPPLNVKAKKLTTTPPAKGVPAEKNYVKAEKNYVKQEAELRKTLKTKEEAEQKTAKQLTVAEGGSTVAEKKAFQEDGELARPENLPVPSGGGQTAKNYALPGNTATGTGTMPNMAVGGVTTPSIIPSTTPNPIKAIGDKAGQVIRKMNNKRVAAGLFVPPLTSCGSGIVDQAFLQVHEVERSFLEGISFEPACQAHDACYGNCQKKTRGEYDREACDNEFNQLMTAICDDVTNQIRRSSCLKNRNLYYSAVRAHGKSAFVEACAATPPAKTRQSGQDIVKRVIDGDGSGQAAAQRLINGDGSGQAAAQRLINR